MTIAAVSILTLKVNITRAPVKECSAYRCSTTLLSQSVFTNVATCWPCRTRPTTFSTKSNNFYPKIAITMNTFFRDIVFKNFSAVPNRFKYHNNACLRDIVSFFLCSSKSFQKREQCIFRDIVFIFSLQFQIVSNTARMQSLEKLCSFLLCSFKSFQIPPECIL